MGTEIVLTTVGLADSHMWKGTLPLSCAPSKTEASSTPLKVAAHSTQAIEMTWLRLNHQYTGTRKIRFKSRAHSPI